MRDPRLFPCNEKDNSFESLMRYRCGVAENFRQRSFIVRNFAACSHGYAALRNISYLFPSLGYSHACCSLEPPTVLEFPSLQDKILADSRVPMSVCPRSCMKSDFQLALFPLLVRENILGIENSDSSKIRRESKNNLTFEIDNYSKLLSRNIKFSLREKKMFFVFVFVIFNQKNFLNKDML